MSVDDIRPIKRFTYTGPGVYGILFDVIDAADLLVKVALNDGSTSTLVKDVDYSVALLTPGANITVTTIAYNSTGVTLSVERSLPYTQPYDLLNGGSLDMPLLTKAFDRTVMLLQQMKAVLDGVSVESNWKGDWITAYNYTAKDTVKSSDVWYSCTADHVSGVFATDLAAGLWVQVESFAALKAELEAILEVTLPAPTGQANKFLGSDGVDYVFASAGLVLQAARSASWTCSVNNLYPVSTSGGAVIVTLPATASNGDKVGFFDLASTFQTNNFTVARNGHKIMGLTQDMNVQTKNASFVLMYYSSTDDWRIIEATIV